MRCRNPISAYQFTAGGHTSVVFSVSATEGHPYLPIELPCGQCISCRIKKSREWALRCMHEGMTHEHNSFITLTYDPAFVPDQLIKQDLTRFFKRLRKALEPDGIFIRYYAVGEYGKLLARPHFHAIIFGYDFPDKFLHTRRRGIPLFRSPLLERVWPFGFSSVGALTFDSAAYVARYCQKKVNGDAAAEHYNGRIPEYSVMSRRPGIGHDWIVTNMDSVYPHDNVIGPSSALMRPPAYYDRIYDFDHADELLRIKRARLLKGREISRTTPDSAVEIQHSLEDTRIAHKHRDFEDMGTGPLVL